MPNIKLLTACVMAATLLTYGCAGGGATVKTTTSTVSIGQQLIDLQKSLESGAMSQDQYDKAKNDLIDRALDD